MLSPSALLGAVKRGMRASRHVRGRVPYHSGRRRAFGMDEMVMPWLLQCFVPRGYGSEEPVTGRVSGEELPEILGANGELYTASQVK